MTPALFDLPLRPNEAAALTRLLFEHAGNRLLNDELRNRLAGRAAALRLETIRPYLGSLETDPIHTSAFYLAADGLRAEGPAVPLLLRIAPASTPASGLFPKSILIGRMRAGNQETVVNAIPFAPADHDAIRTFAQQLNPAFMPRPHGAKTAVSLSTNAPETIVPAAFEAFRAVHKSSGVNMACFWAAAGQAEESRLANFYDAVVWAAIRAGWREGYSIDAELAADGGQPMIADASGYSKFSVDIAGGIEPAVELFQLIRKSKSSEKFGKAFDFEVSFGRTAAATSPEELASSLAALRERGIAAQCVAPNFGSLLPDRLPELAERAKHLVDAARQFQAILTVTNTDSMPAHVLETIVKAAGSRIQLKTACASGPAERVSELVGHLLG